MIITEIQYFFSKIIRFQAIFKDTVEFTCALEFKISSQPLVSVQLLDSCMDLLREPQIVFSEEVKKAFVLQDSFQKETLNFADDILI